ncbi:MAG: chaperone NapD [Pseudomonadota bacterium]
MNICSVIVHCNPSKAESVKGNLEQRQGIDVFGGVKEGKIIVTIEAGGERLLSEIMAEFNQIPGVIDTAMVYHQEENDEDLDKPI